MPGHASAGPIADRGVSAPAPADAVPATGAADA
jgi:hypothetical protein